MLNTTIDVASFASPWTMRPFRFRGIGELWMVALNRPAFRFLMRLQGIGDRSAVSNAGLDTYLTLLKEPDRGRAFLQIMRRGERTLEKQHLYRGAVRDVPYPVQAVWARDDPAMTLATYGEKARAAAGLDRVHVIGGKHFPQEDHAAEIAERIAALATRAARADDRPALVTHDVEKILGRPPQSFAQWVVDHRSLFTK